ncbi:excinuclease ABC subunit C [Pontibacter silvestris]|uniref:Excinuclease ABC subunit C n=1 Tax=Pontibacter silvestris TaxID=2305183 RepID=A0ABW4WY09_9BACT|nr:excinuclease ABC subunit C [Pontibacter silvestris]MCC9135348.1 excinuclease ABC subunit C [Pontibacter silvestris]
MQAQQSHYFVYIMGGQPRSEVKIGIADDLHQYVQAIRSSSPPAVNYATADKNNLVYYEHYDEKEIALTREQQIKDGGADSAFSLIESMNPNWLDLSDML